MFIGKKIETLLNEYSEAKKALERLKTVIEDAAMINGVALSKEDSPTLLELHGMLWDSKHTLQDIVDDYNKLENIIFAMMEISHAGDTDEVDTEE